MASAAEKPGRPSAAPSANDSARTATTRSVHHTAATTSLASTNQWRPTGSASRFFAVPSVYSRPKT